MKDCVIVFVKYPTPGKVKTRLAVQSSPELAAQFYAVLVQVKLKALSDGLDADILVFFSPAGAVAKMQEWLGRDMRFLPQKGDGLGSRMANAFRTTFDLGYKRAILVGSDIPAFTPEIASQALSRLTPQRACIGPAKDGGYYLIGFHKDGLASQIFTNMEWSTPEVCQQTVTRLKDAQLDVATLPRLSDLDTMEDLQDHLRSGTLPPEATAAAKALLEEPSS